MLDPLLTSGFFLHFAALLGLLLLFLKRQKTSWADLPVFVFLLGWTSVVFAAQMASAMNMLDSLPVYIISSVLSLGLVLFFFNALNKTPSLVPPFILPALSFSSPESPRARKGLFWFLAISLGLFAFISIFLGLNVYPDNADSIIYRLPRAIWYVSHSSFLHPFEAQDKRLIFYPLDGVSLYVPLVLYNLPGNLHVLPSLASWMIIVFAAYRFARELGADRLISLFSAWLIGLTPSILAQATSTNDEILAAASLLCGLLMLWRWAVTGRHVYFLLAGIGVALSAGTKLHIVFLMPIIVAGFALVFLTQRKKSNLLTLGRALGGKTWVITLLTAFILFAPFLFYNYASCGRFYFFDDFKKDVFNLSASLQCGLQNLLIYFSQMIFSPIADLNFWPVANDRQAFNTALNNLIDPFIAPFIDKSASFYHLSYRFVGVTLPVSVRFVEFSLWSAFVWLLWPLQAIGAIKQKKPLRSLLLLVALCPLFWLIEWSFTTLYMEGTATYFAFYLICAAPTAALTFATFRRAWTSELRWVVIVIVAACNLLISCNLLMFSGFRAIPDLFYARELPYDWLLTEDTIIKEIRAAETIRIPYLHEKMPFFGLMHWNPRAKYLSPYKLSPDQMPPHLEKTLEVYPASSMYMYGFMPIKIPGKRNPGATYLGAIRGIGREIIFARGNGVEKRYPTESDYILLQLFIEKNTDGAWTLSFANNPQGFSPDDHLTFTYELRQKDRLLATKPASPDPSLTITLPENPHELSIPLTMTIIVKSEWNDKEVTRATYQVGGYGAWLADIGEY